MTSLEESRAAGGEQQTSADAAGGPVPDFRVEVSAGPDEAVVAAFGEVDLASADELRRPIVELLDAGARSVLVDLRGVTFLDSTGIHVLVAAHRHAGALGARMPLVLGGRATRRVLELTGLMDHFEIVDGA
jgi:anti-sigma B factor antagonist